MTKVLVETRVYVFSHGKQPRGRGFWAFTFGTRTYEKLSEVWWAPGSMMYGEAVKLARLEAARRGAIYISTQA